MEQKIKQLIGDSITVKTAMLDKNTAAIKTIAEQIIKCYRNKNKVVIFGNGGSAADAQHFAGEMACRFEKERPGLPCIAFTTDTSIMTAIGNDYSFDRIFSRQVESIVNPGDIVIGISTSGNSKNVIEGLIQAKKQNAVTIGFTNETGGKMKQYCDYCLCIPSKITARVQEGHGIVIHILCSLIEQEVFK
jgi:D-sedoheptulose 7-phosphate isomerase